MPGPSSLTVVIPIHNEAGFLAGATSRLLEVVDGFASRTGCEPLDVILVENGSTDGTAAEAARLAATDPRLAVRSLPEPDYGAALRDGMLAATGEWLVAFDIDYFSGEFLDRLVDLVDRADAVLASKRDPATHDRRSVLRRLGTRVFNLLLRALFGSRMTDTHGMKALRAAMVAEVIGSVVSTRDLFDTELLLRAERAGYRIVEVPAVVEEVRLARSSFLKRVPRTLAGLIRLRLLFRREARREYPSGR